MARIAKNKKMTAAAKRSRTVPAKHRSSASRRTTIKNATRRVSAKTSIDFRRSVRGR